MARVTGKKVLGWVGIALSAISAGGLVAMCYKLFDTELGLAVRLYLVGFYAVSLALGLWMVRLSRRPVRAARTDVGEPSEPQARTTEPSTPKPASKPEPKPEPKSAPKPASKPEPKPEPKSAPKPASKPEPKPEPKSAPKPASKPAPQLSSAPAPKPQPDPFATYEEASANSRSFKVASDQIHLSSCPELEGFEAPYDHKVAATIGLALRGCGYEMSSLTIGGGIDEVSHTGAVAYGGDYKSLDEFITTAPDNYKRAKEHATELYDIWFSSLDWSWVHAAFEREGSRVVLEIDALLRVILTWMTSDWSRFEDEVTTVKLYLCEG